MCLLCAVLYHDEETERAFDSRARGLRCAIQKTKERSGGKDGWCKYEGETYKCDLSLNTWRSLERNRLEFCRYFVCYNKHGYDHGVMSKVMTRKGLMAEAV